MGPDFIFITNPSGEIVKWDGQIEQLLGVKPEDLANTPIVEIFHEKDRSRIRHSVFDSGSLDQALISGTALHHRLGGFIKLDTSVNQEQSGHLRFSFWKPSEGPSPVPSSEAKSDAKEDEAPAPALGRELFFSMVESFLSEQGGEEQTSLVLTQIEALSSPQTLQLLGPKRAAELRQSVEATLRAASSNGDIGQLGADSYGLLTDGGVTHEQISANVVEVADTQDFGIDDLGVRGHGLVVDEASMDAEALTQTVSFVEKRLSGDIEGSELPDRMSGAVEQVVASTAQVRAALERRQMQLVERDVVDIDTDRVPVRIARPEMLIDDRPVHVSRLLNIEDYPELALQHDLAALGACARQVVQERADSGRRPAPILAEVLIESVRQPMFLDGVQACLTGTECPSTDIGIKLTELRDESRRSGAIDNLITLSEDGHIVWLDEFNTAVSGLGRLKKAKNGFVEVPARILQSLCSKEDGRKLVIKLIGEWTHFDFYVVATNVENDEQRNFLRELGINYTVSPDTKTNFAQS